jgi:hypothetical protein
MSYYFLTDSENCTSSKSLFRRSGNGMAHGMDRLKAIGNGQVPAVAKLAWEILNDTR